METSTTAQAIERLIADYGKLVFHIIYGLTHDWHESEDLTQETFLQAFRGMDAAREFSGPQFQAKAWLLRIAVNTVRMARRRRRFTPGCERPLMRDEDQQVTEISTTYEEMQEAGDLETIVAERDVVQRCMQQLPEALRIPLLLSIVAGFSSREIARLLTLKEPAVRQRLTRARNLFRQLYARESGEHLRSSGQCSRAESTKGEFKTVPMVARPRTSRSRNHLGHRSLALAPAHL
ncbi:MAG TPA: sigma-70 family RNA polymerase sigma factor [Ktedonosporobacter sp.]|nr:sigma-70 family RNA polymerase sigma factor [Ktedonosporobacter sp.]